MYHVCDWWALCIRAGVSMIMAFMLMVMVDGEMRETKMMYFRDVNRCNFFANALEKGTAEFGQHLITAWCEPKMVNENETFWD